MTLPTLLRTFLTRKTLMVATWAAGSLMVLASGIATAANWPSWRGPSGTGVAAGKDFPTSWGTGKQIRWSYAIPGKGASTPIVWDDHVVISYGKDHENRVVCLSRAGKPLWDVAVGKEQEGKHAKATGCNPSAVTDGKLVYVYFKSGDLAALDWQGKTVWHINLQEQFGEDTLWWDLGTSPVLTEKNVVVAVMQSGPSYLVALDKQSGKVAWKQDRVLDAPEEAAQSYSTPVVYREGDKERLIVLGADHVTCHEASDGAEVWRVGGLNPTRHQYFRSIASPVVTDGMVIAPYARGDTVTGIKLGGKGDVTKTHVAWTRSDLGADVPTPAAQGDRVYLCTDKGELVCLAAKTGKTLWNGQPEKNRQAFSASPILAGDKIYLTREDGKVFVTSADAPFQVISENVIGEEQTVATPVLVDGLLFLRTIEHLYCIGK